MLRSLLSSCCFRRVPGRLTPTIAPSGGCVATQQTLVGAAGAWRRCRVALEMLLPALVACQRRRTGSCTIHSTIGPSQLYGECYVFTKSTMQRGRSRRRDATRSATSPRSMGQYLTEVGDLLHNCRAYVIFRGV